MLLVRILARALHRALQYQPCQSLFESHAIGQEAAIQLPRGLGVGGFG